MLALIDKSPTITEAYDTSTIEFSDYLDEVAAWFENQHRDYASSYAAQDAVDGPPQEALRAAGRDAL